MAISLARVALNRIYPASIYSRPALSPMVVGADGKPGYAQENLNNMYKYTLQQMAVSPFSVNSQEYMKRIREEYRYSDTGFYDAMGTVGSVVGAGMGAMFGANMIDWKGFRVEGFKKSEWYKPGSYQFPFEIKKPDTTKREGTSEGFRQYNKDYEKLDKTLVNDYNTKVDAYTTDAKALNKVVKDNDLSKLNKATIDLDGLKETDSGYAGAKATVDKLRKDVDADVLKQYDDVHDAYKTSKTALTTSQDALTNSIKATKGLDTADAIIDTVKSGAKIGAKAAGALMGIAGTAMDVGSLGMNIAGAAQAFSDKDIINGMLYTVGAVGDVISIAGDVAQFIPVVGTVLGTVANIVGTAMSALSGAIIGARVGETVGHSLTPEGARAQALFAENLYGSLTQRPLTSIATVLTTFAVPRVLNKLPGKASNFFANNVWGNYMRSAASMGITQLVNVGTTAIEDAWRPPEEAADVNFVTAFSVVGDLNDNLFGATNAKATLIGLASGDPSAQTKALARAWGQSDEDIYYNPAFDDFRQAAGWDFGNLGNSIVGVIGEVLIDPQNRSEIADTMIKDKVSDAGAHKMRRQLVQAKAQFIVDPSKVEPKAAALLFKKTKYKDNEYYTKSIYYNEATDVYYDKATEGTKEVIIYKDEHGIYRNAEDDTELSAVNVAKAYDTADFNTTLLGSLDENSMTMMLKRYFSAYMQGGIDAVRSVHIDSTTQTQKGSRSKVIQTTEDFFVDNVTSFIKYTLEEPSVSTANIEDVEQAMKTLPGKFANLYKYYNIKDQDPVELITKLKYDFDDIEIKSDYVNKLYNLSASFSNQMDLIQSTTTTITKIANPLGWVGEEGIKKFIDFATGLRYEMETKYRAKMLIELEESLNTNNTHIVSQKDIEDASNKVKTSLNKEYKEDLISKAVSNDPEVQQLKQEYDAFETIKKENEQKIKDINEFKKGQSLRIYDRSRSSTYVEVTDINAAKNEIIELRNKKIKTPEESLRLRLLEEGFVQAMHLGWVADARIQTHTKIGTLIGLLDSMVPEASKYTTNLIMQYNKFCKLVASNKITAQQYNEEYSKLEKFFALTGIEIIKSDAHINPDNVHITINMDLPEYICSVLNRYILEKFGEDNYAALKIIDVHQIKECLGNINTLESWSKLNIHAQENLLKTIIASFVNKDDQSIYRAFLYVEDAVSSKVLGTINEAVKRNKGKNNIQVYKPLVDVDVDFLKRKIISELLKQPEFADTLKLALAQIKDIQNAIEFYTKKKEEVINRLKNQKTKHEEKYLKALEEQYDLLVTILNKQSNEYLNRVLKKHPMFSLLKEYIYTDIRQGHSFIPSVFFSELYATLDNNTLKKLKDGTLTEEENIEAAQKLAQAPILTSTSEVYRQLVPDNAEEEEVNLIVKEVDIEIDDAEETLSNIKIDSGEEFVDDTNIDEQLKKQVNEEANTTYHIDKLESNQIVKTNFKFKTNDIAKNVCDICTNVKDTIDEEKGYVEINIKPTTFVDQDGNVWYYSELFDPIEINGKSVKGVTQSRYYRTNVEEGVDKLIKMAEDGLITILGARGKVYGTNAKKIRKYLINAYMNANKDSKGVTIRFNNINKRTNKSTTGYYFRRLLKRELNKTIYVKLVDYGDGVHNAIDVDGSTLLIPKEYNTPSKVYMYLKNIINNDLHKDYALCKKFLEDAYDRAIKYINRNLAYDKNLGINRDIIDIVKNLKTFETNSIQSRHTSTPVVATDLIKQHLSTDEEFDMLLADIALLSQGNTTGQTTILGKMIVSLREYIEESSGTKERLDIKKYTGIDKKDGEFYFITTKGTRVAFTHMMLNYEISSAQLDKLLNQVLKSENKHAITHYYTEVFSIYNNYMNILFNKATKEEFVDMVLAGMPNAVKEEVEQAYDILYNNPQAYELLRRLTFETRGSQKEDAATIYNKEILDLYIQSFKNFKPTGAENEIEKHFLKAILLWKPSNIKLKEFLLDKVFFKDFKESRGIFNDTHIKNLEYSIEVIKAAKEKDPSNNAYNDLVIKDLESRIEYCKKGQKAMKATSKQDWIQYLLNIQESDIGNVLDVFVSTKRISDTEKYAIVRDGNKYVVAYKDSAEFFKPEGKGAGKSNLYILSKFEERFTSGSKTQDDKIYVSGNSALLVTSKELTKAQIAEQKKKYLEENPNIKYFYIITRKQYKQIREMYKEGKVITYTERKRKGDETWELHTVDTKINVQSAKVIAPSYMEDLANISKYITEYKKNFKDSDPLEIFYTFMDTYKKYPMLQKSYISKPSLMSSKYFKALGEDAETTRIFFSVMRKFKGKISVNVLKDYINDDVIKERKPIIKNSTVWKELEEIDIEGKSAASILEEEIARLQQEHISNPFKVSLNYNNALSHRLTTGLLQIKSIVHRAVAQESDAIDQSKWLRKAWKAVHDTNMDLIVRRQIAEQQNFNDDIIDKCIIYKDDGSIDSDKTYNNLKNYYKSNKADLVLEYLDRNQKHFIERQNKKEKKLNFRTMHDVIKQLNNSTELFERDINGFIKFENNKYVYKSDLLKVLLDNEYTDNVISALKDKQVTDDEIEKIIYEDILYPFIQNISLDFYIKKLDMLEQAEAILDYMFGGDKRYAAASLYQHLIKPGVNLEAFTSLIDDYSIFESFINEDLKKYIPDSTAEKLKEEIEKCKKIATRQPSTIKQLNEHLLNFFISHISKGSKYKNEFHPEVFKNYGKQRTTINSGDFNRYQYKEGTGLQRADYIVFENGTFREDQKNVKTIAETVSSNKGVSVTSDVNNMLTIIANKLSNSREYTPEKNDKFTKIEKELSDNNIVTSRGLTKFIIDTALKKLNLADDPKYRDLIKNAIDLYRVLSRGKDMDTAERLSELIDTVSQDLKLDGEKLWDTVQDIVIDWYPHYLYLRQNEYNSSTTFKSSGQFVRSIDSDIFDHSREFFTWIKKNNNLKLPKFLKDKIFVEFTNAKTLVEFYRNIYTYITEDNRPEFFALIVYINHYKKLYRNYKKKTNWDDAYTGIQQVEYASNIKKFDDLDNRFGKGIKAETTIYESLEKPLHRFRTASKFVKGMNSELNRVITPGGASAKTAEPKTIFKQERGFTVALRQINRYTTSPLFAKDKEYNFQGDTENSIKLIMETEHLELVQEMSASTLEECFSTTSVYGNIRRLFTDLLKLCNIRGATFVRIMEITNALRSIEEDVNVGKFYIDQFEFYTSKKSIDQGELDKAFEAIKDYFNKDYLTKMNDNRIKAIMGYIYYNTYTKKTTKTKVQEMTRALRKIYQNVDSVMYAQSRSQSNAIRKICEDESFTDDVRTEKIFKIFYPDKEINKESDEYKRIYNMVKSTYNIGRDLQSANTFDTWDDANAQIESLTWEEYKDKSKYIKIKKEQVEDIQHKIDITKEKINELKNKEHKINESKAGKITSTEVKIDDDTNLNELIKDLELLQSQLVTAVEEKEKALKEAKDNAEDKLDQLQIHFLDTELGQRYSNIYTNKRKEYFGPKQDKSINNIKSKIELLIKLKDADGNPYFTKDDIVEYCNNMYKRLNGEEFDTDIYDKIKSLRSYVTDNATDKVKKVVRNAFTEIYKDIKNVQDINVHLHRYDNIDTDEELKLEYAHQVFKEFIYVLRKAKKSVHNSLLKELKDALIGEQDNVTINKSLDKRNRTFYEKLIKQNVQYFQNSYNNLKKRFAFLELPSFDELDIKNPSTVIMQTLLDAVYNTNNTYTKLRDEAYKRIKEYNTEIKLDSAFTKSVARLNKDDLEKIITGFTIDSTKRSEDIQKDLFQYVYINKLDIKSFVQGDTAEAKILLRNYDNYCVNIYNAVIINTNKVYNTMSTCMSKITTGTTRITNLELNTHVDDTDYTEIVFKNIMKVLETEEVPQEILDYTDEIVNRKFAFNIYNNKEVTSAQTTYTRYKKKAQDNDDLIKDIKELKTEKEYLEELEAKKRTADTFLKDAEENVRKSYEAKDYIASNSSNSKMYVRFTKDKSKKYQKQITDETHIVQHVCDRAVDDGFISREAIDKLLNETGGALLHNPVVDCLITQYNYMYIQGYIDEEGKIIKDNFKPFVVMDMETLVDITGEPVPYQINIIEVTYENGKLNSRVTTVYYNNYVFLGAKEDLQSLKDLSDLSTLSTDLQAFVRQQQKMYLKDEPNLDDKEILNRIINTVELATSRKNTLEQTEAVMTILNNRTRPIVAHNGKRFDFVHYDNFMKTYVRKLIQNEYFNHYFNTPTMIRDNLDPVKAIDTLDITEQEKESLKAELSRIQQDYKDGKFQTELELSRFESCMQKLLDAFTKTVIKGAILRAAKELNISIKSEDIERIELGKNATFNKVIDYCYDYLMSTNKEEYIKNLDTGDLDKATLKLLCEAVDSSFRKENKDVEYTKSILKTIQERIINQYKLPVDLFNAYDNEQRLHTIERNISSVVSLIEHIDSLNKDGKFPEYEEVLAEVSANVTQLEAVIKEYETKIINLEIDIKNAEENITKYNKQLYDAMKQITNITLKQIQKAKSILYRDYENALNQLNIKDINTKDIKYNILKAEEQIQDSINVLNAFIKAVQEGKDIDINKLNDLLLDSQIHSVINKNTRDDLIKRLETRTQEIEGALKVIDDDAQFKLLWESIWKELKDNATHNVEVIREKLIFTIEILLKRNDVPEAIREVLTKYINKEYTEKSLYDALLEISNTKDGEFIRNDDTMHKVITSISKNSTLIRNIELSELTETPAYIEENKTLLRYHLTREQGIISTTLTVAKAMNIKNEKILYDDVHKHVENILKSLQLTELETDLLQTEIIEKAVFRHPYKSKNTGLTAQEQADQEKLFYEHASDIVSKDNDFYKAWPEVKRLYEDLNEGNDIWAVTEGYDIVTRYEDKNGIKLTVNTPYYHKVQTLYIPKHNGKISNSSEWYYDFQYSYNLKGRMMDKTKVHTKHMKYSDVKETSIYGTNSSKTIAPYAYDDMQFEDGVDYNKQAILKLRDFAIGLDSASDKQKYIKNETVDIKDFDTKNFTKINLSDIVRKKFMEQLRIMHIAQDLAGMSVFNLSELYRVIFRQVMGNLNAIKPGMYIMQIPKEHEGELIAKMSKEGKEKLEVDIFKVSESNMGYAMSEETMYSIKALFGANTGPVRTVLTTNILHSKFTPITVNNDLFERQDADSEKKALEDYIWNTDSEEFKAWADMVCEREYKESGEALKENGVTLEEYKEYRIAVLKAREQFRHDALIGDKEYIDPSQKRSAFTLCVGQQDTIYKYDKDVFHPIGVNVKVAFTTDRRAYEDELLIDAEWAENIGFYEANKVWLKYGFKGTVKFVNGLSKMYNGANIVSRKDSVESRGSKGLYLEMFGNYLLDYLTVKNPKLSQKALEIFNTEGINEIKKYIFKNFEDEKYLKLKQAGDLPEIYVVGGRLIMEHSEHKDYEKFLNNLINGNVNILGEKTGKKNKITLKYEEALIDHATGKYTYVDPASNKHIDYEYKDGHNEILSGTLFVIMDPEHQASHMQSELALQLTEHKGLTYVLKDAKGSVRKGGQKSFTVEQSFAQKIGYDIDQYIVGAEYDKDVMAQYKTSWDIYLKGMKAFTPIRDDKGIIQIDRTVESILTNNKLPTSYKIILREYYKALALYEADPNESIYLERLTQAETKVKNHALKLWGGDTGVGYSHNYRRFNASRNQLTANTNLVQGEIKFPADSFENLRKADANNMWIHETEISIEDINLLFKEHSERYNDELIEFTETGTLKGDQTTERLVKAYKLLRYYGILSGYEVKGRITTYMQDSEITSYIKSLQLKPGELKKTEAYVLAIRYPVQDYNATPIVKITGIVEHSAVECNAIMYKTMGADNDGDAASFTMIKRDSILNSNSPIQALNASNLDYYDKGEANSLTKDFNKIPENKVELNTRYGTNTSYIGKKTAPSSAYNIVNGKVIKLGDKISVRSKDKDTGDNHYTYTEMIMTNASLYKELLNKVPSDYKYNEFEGAEKNDMFWLNSHIWLHNAGKNIPEGYEKNFYDSADAIQKYYDANQPEIENIKRVEHWLNYTEDGNDFIEKHLEEIIEAANSTTLTRGRISKVNIGITGGYRKGIYLGTTLSIFPNLNKDKSGLSWKQYGIPSEIIDDKEVIKDFTVMDIFNNIIIDKNALDKLSVKELQNLIDKGFNGIKQYIKNEYIKDKIIQGTDQYINDIDKVSVVVLEHYLETRIAEQCIIPLVKFLTEDNPTFEQVEALYKNNKGEEIDILLEPMTYVRDYINDNPSIKTEVVPPALVALIQSYYLSRFIPEFNKTIKDNTKAYQGIDYEKVKETYLKGLNDELFLTRALSKQLNDMIQDPISISKHGSAIANYTEVDKSLRDNAESISNYLVKNKIFFGKSYKHSRAVAMGAEYNIHERKNIRFENPEDIKTKRKEYANNSVSKQHIDPTDPEGSLKKAVLSIIVDDICGSFVTENEVKEFIKHFRIFTEVLTNHITQERKLDLTKLSKRITELNDAVKYFENLNISLYRLIKGSEYMLNKVKEAQSYRTNINVPEVAHNLLGLYSLRGLDKDWYREQSIKLNNEDLKYFINYLTEEDNPIDEEATLTADANYIEGKYSSEDYYQAMLNDKEIFGDSDNIQRLEDKNALIQDRLMSEYNIPNHISITGLDVFKEFLINIERLNKVRKDSLDELNKNHIGKTTSEVQQEIVNKRIGYKAIRNPSEKASKVYSSLNEAKAELENLKKEAEQLKILKADQEQEKNYYESIKHSLEGTKPEEVLERLNKHKASLEEESKQVSKQHIKYALLSNLSEVSTLLINSGDDNIGVKVLEEDDVELFKNNMLLNMDMYQHPFSILYEAFTRKLPDGTLDTDWDAMYNYIVKNYGSMRITEVVKAYDDEGLARTLIDHIKVEDNNLYKNSKGEPVPWKALTKKEQRKRINKLTHKKVKEIKTWDDLDEATKGVLGNVSFRLGNKTYDQIDKDLKNVQFVSPTLKQIKVKSGADLKRIWEEGILKNNLSIGFTYINDILSATEDAYKPYVMEGRGAYIAQTFNMFQKALMRFSSGFLLRNAMDTFNQLMSDMYLEKGLQYTIGHPLQTLKYLQYGSHIYSMYELISEERLFTLSDIHITYKNIEKATDMNTINKLSLRLKRYLETYVKQGEALENKSSRIKHNLERAKQLLQTYESSKYINKALCKNIFTFLGNISFAEYYEFYDNKIINGEPVLGLRIDATTDARKQSKKIARLKTKHEDDLFKYLLIEISAFVQTNAQMDIFKEKQYNDLFKLVDRTKMNMLEVTEEKAIEDIEKEIQILRADSENKLKVFLSNKNIDGYKWLTNRTENLARILGYILNRDLYGYTYERSVQLSLKSWFNYGQRSPIEMQLMYDIPYISFPIRSIANWRSRLLDPKYARLMDDLIDGIYSQYSDEDGQYDEYTQFMIKNGWIPITDKLGIRAGSGAFDIMNLITDAPENIAQRRNPILRGLQAFINSGDVTQAMSQLASVGKLKQATQAMTLGAYKTKTQTMGEPSLGKTFTMFFEYNQYTPKKYDYLYNGNGRYKYYENIYRDWFTKYGRMRKPTVDPVQLVNNIQWKQFLRRMQHKYRR